MTSGRNTAGDLFSFLFFYLLLSHRCCRVVHSRTLRSNSGTEQRREPTVKECECGRSWPAPASLIAECGSPGNPKGVHQSGSGAAEASGNTPGVPRRVEIRWWEMLRECGGGRGEGETIAGGSGGVGGWNVSRVAVHALYLQGEGRLPAGGQQGASRVTVSPTAWRSSRTSTLLLSARQEGSVCHTLVVE